ncbi:hypothetical protein D081_1487 [Anaerovibrio sp. JC8]|nr:hypothetical protein D081_1487 [Anaerovibrio sp. JC8]
MGQYSWAYLVCSKINLDSGLIQSTAGTKNINDIGWDIMSAVKLDMDDRLRQLEASVPGSITLSATACNLCEECTRKSGLPCCQPDKMRYAIDAFGFKIVDITKDVFSIDIQWTTDRLPEYYTLVHGFLTKDEVSEALWSEIIGKG